MSPKRLAQKTRRPKLTRERVLAAAIRIADEEGLAALSMRRLAQKLRVEAMSLYKYFPNKETILDGIVELVLGEVSVPVVGAAWQMAMRERASSARSVCLRHPWAAALSESRSTAGPVRLGLCNAVLSVLIEAGFSLELAQCAFLTLDSYIYGFTLQEVHWPFGAEQCQQAIETFVQRTPLDGFEHLAAVAEHARHSGAKGAVGYDEKFAFGLELILDGLERARRSG